MSVYPARFANRERIVAVAVATRDGVTRRHVERTSNDDDLVFDDASFLQFEQPGSAEPPALATWHWISHRRLTFRFTPETIARLKEELAAELPFRMRVRVGRGRVVFSRDHQRYRGTQLVRATGDYRGVHVVVVERIGYTGTRASEGAAAVGSAGSLRSGLLPALSPRAALGPLLPE